MFPDAVTLFSGFSELLSNRRHSDQMPEPASRAPSWCLSSQQRSHGNLKYWPIDLLLYPSHPHAGTSAWDTWMSSLWPAVHSQPFSGEIESPSLRLGGAHSEDPKLHRDSTHENYKPICYEGKPSWSPTHRLETCLTQSNAFFHETHIDLFSVLSGLVSKTLPDGAHQDDGLSCFLSLAHWSRSAS